MKTNDLIKRARELAALRNGATQGPWYSIPNPEWRNAKCRIDNRPDVSWGNFGQICYAAPGNAPLIAAALEMAELLERMSVVIETQRETIEAQQETIGDLSEIANQKG